MFKPIENKVNISFQQLYLDFSQYEDQLIRDTICKSLHEAFRIIDDDEDTFQIRKVFLNYLTDNNREQMLVMNQNLSVMI